MKKFIFLDRDGTLIKESRTSSNPKGYFLDMKDLYTIPGSIFGIGLLNEMGYKIIVITNQSAVGRGIVTEGFVDEVHKEIDKIISRGGAVIDDYFCSCRKPKPGMIFSAAEKYDIDLEQSYFIGDSARDILCSLSAGVRPILVLTGGGELTFDSFSEKEKAKLEYVAQDLLDAAQYLCNK